jgi:type I restriction enzyme, S subunit
MSDEVLWELPNTWEWTTIADLGNVVSGGTPSTKDTSYWNGEINWITPADLSGYSNKFITRGAKSLTADGLANSSAKLMPAGSIHFSSRAPIGYVVISQAEISTSQGFKSLIPAQGIFNEYVYYYLRSAKYIAEERAGGTTFKELSGKAFAQLPVPIAPLNEQCRIVNHVEELLSELDKGIEYLRTAQAQLKIYRQSALKYAFEGTLTAQWRKAHAQLETADQLLERIQQERRNTYRQQLNDWEEETKIWKEHGKKGKRPTKPKKPSEITSLTEDELLQLPQLPKGWCWSRVEALGEVQLGRQRSPQNRSRNYPTKYIRAANIKEDGFDLTNVMDMEFQPHELERYQLKYGDILLSEASGSAEQVGKPALWRDQIQNCCFQNTVIRFQPICLSSTYMLSVFKHFYFNKIFSKSVSGVGTGLFHSEQYFEQL